MFARAARWYVFIYFVASISTTTTTTDLEWKVVYVGSAQTSDHDQVLDEILVGPVPVGMNKFVLQADPPDASKLPEVLGVTVILVKCSYKEQEFVQVGYYVNNEYTGEYNEEEGPPKDVDLKLVQRQILADKPRVTKFPITWGTEPEMLRQDEDSKMEAVGTPSTTATEMDLE